MWYNRYSCDIIENSVYLKNMINNLQPEFSFCSWYKQFIKCSLVATIIQIPDEILKYLEYDMFLLPLEAIKHNSSDNEWNDSLQNDEVFYIFYYCIIFVSIINIIYMVIFRTPNISHHFQNLAKAYKM